VRNLPAALTTLRSLAQLLTGYTSKINSLDTKNLCSGKKFDPLLARDSVGENSSVLLVVHEQEFEVGSVVDEELLVARGDEVSGFLVGSVTDLGHGGLSLESSSHLGC
jgi:hypothetical protein